MKGLKKIFIVLSWLLICVACGGTQKGIEVENPDLDLPIPPVKAYHNKAHDVRINYPLGWKYHEMSDSEVYFMSEGSDGSENTTRLLVTFTTIIPPVEDLTEYVSTLRPGVPFESCSADGFSACLVSEEQQLEGTEGRVREAFMSVEKLLVYYRYYKATSLSSVDVDDFVFQAGEEAGKYSSDVVPAKRGDDDRGTNGNSNSESNGGKAGSQGVNARMYGTTEVDSIFVDPQYPPALDKLASTLNHPDFSYSVDVSFDENFISNEGSLFECTYGGNFKIETSPTEPAFFRELVGAKVSLCIPTTVNPNFNRIIFRIERTGAVITELASDIGGEQYRFLMVISGVPPATIYDEDGDIVYANFDPVLELSNTRLTYKIETVGEMSSTIVELELNSDSNILIAE